jgi:hypothetical protein
VLCSGTTVSLGQIRLSFPSLPPVYLAGRPDASLPRPAAPPAAQPHSSEAAEAWDKTKDTLEAFVARYKDTYYAELARAQLEIAKKQQSALALPHAATKFGAASEVSPSQPQGFASSQFDGTWRPEWLNNEHCKRKTEATNWAVTNGILVTGLGHRGTVDSEGQLRLKYPCYLNPAKTCSVRARLQGGRGTGNFFSSGGCGGTVTLTRL